MALIPLLGFPRVHASYTRRNNTKETYIHQIMPWIAFKILKKVQVTYFDLLKLCPPFIRLSFTLGCCKPAVSKAEHLQKLSTIEARPKNLVGQVLKLENFPLGGRRNFKI